VFLRELTKEGRTLNPVKDSGGPIERLAHIQQMHMRRVRELMEKFAQNRQAQVEGCGFPVEHIGSAGPLTMPKDPRRENSVKKRLHQRRAEEMKAALCFHLQAKSRFE